MAERHGYQEVRTPVVEPTALFVRSIGEATDIVEKEMYSFERHGDALTLRPEGTAGVVRAYVEHHVATQEPLTRWYYLGPMFPGERPARGRYRQFYQMGCEVYGDPGPASDAEMIDMLVGFFRSIGIGELEVLVNSLGGPATRPRYKDALVAFLAPKMEQLGEDSKRRLATNPLRILDSKDPRDIAALEGAPSITDVLDGDDVAHWEQLQSHLDRLGTPYRREPKLVRGLDYYTRTLFEIRTTSGDVGAQNAIGGGGRYDGLVQEIGGPATPAIGFALGVERILLAMPKPVTTPPPTCFVAPIGSKAAAEALVIARELRDRGLRVDVDTRGAAGASIKAMLRRANAAGTRVCLVLGDAEVESGQVQVKDLIARTQHLIPRADVLTVVTALMNQADPSGGAA